MSRIKRLYICLLAGWLVFCAVRVLLPYLGDYYCVRAEGGYVVFRSCVDMEAYEAQGQMPAALFAELNARLEAAQPGTRFFYTPCETTLYTWKGLLCTPSHVGKPELSPAAEQVQRAWHEETGYWY